MLEINDEMKRWCFTTIKSGLMIMNINGHLMPVKHASKNEKQLVFNYFIPLIFFLSGYLYIRKWMSFIDI